MSLDKTPLTVRPPYPDSDPSTPNELYPPSPHDSPAFDLTDLPEAQQAKKMTRGLSSGSDATATGGGGVTLPESLRIGAESSGAQSPMRGSNEMWRGLQGAEGEIPEILRPGGGVVRAKSPVGGGEYTHGAPEMDPEVNPWMKEKGKMEEVNMNEGVDQKSVYGGHEEKRGFGEKGGYGGLDEAWAEGQESKVHGAPPALLPGGEDKENQVHGAPPVQFHPSGQDTINVDTKASPSTAWTSEPDACEKPPPLVKVPQYLSPLDT